MDILQGFIETGNVGRSGWRIYNNKGTFGIVNNRTSNVSYSILNNGIIGTGSDFVSTYVASSPSITATPTTTGTTGNYTYQVFTYMTETAGAGTGQSLYNITVPTGGVVCDVLVVGGGGGGDKQIGAGGGGGAVLYASGITIPANNYTIKVGKGGAPNVNGSSSEAFGATCLGGGSTLFVGWSVPNGGRAGGSGSGGSSGDQSGTASGGGVGVSTKGTLLSSGTLYNGNIGGNASGLSGSEPRPGGSGGGGGAGTVGKNAVQVEYLSRQAWLNAGSPSVGGNGVPINITGTEYYWGAGGGGGYHVGYGADGGLGGGGGGCGYGGSDGSAGLAGIGGISAGGNAIASGEGGNGGANTGSGGGGGSYYGSIGSSGGSGIVIIRYLTPTTSSSVNLIQSSNINVITNYVGATSSGTTGGGSSQWTTVAGVAGSGTKIYYNDGNIGVGTIDPIAPLHIYNNTTTSTLPTEIVVAGATTGTISGTIDRYISFPYSGSATTKDYTFTTTENLVCDILIVGGGGGGGTGHGGGGGAGALIYTTNQTLSSGAYTISVGNGGTPASGRGIAANNGQSSSIIFNSSTIYLAIGGGGGGGAIVAGANGGSGGGGDAAVGGTALSTNTPSGNYGFAGGTGANGYTNDQFWSGGGGGGAGAVGGNAVGATTTFAGNGGIGREINIMGAATYYAGGGGGGVIGNSTGGIITNIGSGGNGGGGAGGKLSVGVSGLPNTGGGGGGGGFNGAGSGPSSDFSGGAGGSGIVIIRYRKQTQLSVSNSRLLLDATTTGTAAIEFRRGVGADMQNDFRIINDSTPANGVLKLLCENSTQSFGDATANIVWFSSNETILYKNTTMNGRVGIGGTTYHTTRSLDVVGDANVSGAMSAGSLSASSATITNSSSSNVSLTIQNGFVSLPNEIVVSPLPNEIVVSGTTSGLIGTTERYISFPYSGSATTKDYTFTTTENLICDILVVGGGGGGGKRGGAGGGAGTLLYHKNVNFNTGTFTIGVGKGGLYGGTTGTTWTTIKASPGGDSSVIYNSTTIYRAKGGGGGQGGDADVNNDTSGGSSGGGNWVGTADGLATNNIFNGVTVSVSNNQYVNTLASPEGCRGNIGGNQLTIYKGGGGGGAGSAGMNHDEESTVNDGYGGLGLAVDITGTSVVYAGGGNGCDYSGALSQVFDPAYSTIQTRGGGGFGSDNGTAQNGLDGTGGGGGGQGNDSSTTLAGSGGSGIVIIRYRKPPAETVVSAIIPGTTDRYISFPYSGTGTTKDYTITTTENLICDILVVGGGGAGGSRIGGGGGAGALIYITNQSLSTGEYSIKVGRGGIGISTSSQNIGEVGKDSEIYFNTSQLLYRAKGGGGGDGNALAGTNNTALVAGGSSGGVAANFNNGANNYISSGASPLSTNTITINAITTTIAPNNTSVYGYSGGGGYIFDGRYMSGGGGGAGSIGQSINTTAFTKAGDGGNAISISITGSSVAYAGGGGGGGGIFSVNKNWVPGLGGSVNSIRVGGNGGYLKASTTVNGITYSAEGVGGDGVVNTGSGGGGSGSDDIAQGTYSYYKAGSGGSGIVILRYRKLTTSSTSIDLTAPSSSTSITEPVPKGTKQYPETPSTTADSWTDNGFSVVCKSSDAILSPQNTCYLFNNLIASPDHYHSTQLFNGSSPFNYTSSTSFKGANGLVIYIDLGRSITVRNMRFAPRDNASHPTLNFLAAAPGIFKIYASNDSASWTSTTHSSWTEIHSQTTSLTFNYNQYTEFGNFSSINTPYRYFAMVVYNLSGNYSYLTFSEWDIFGTYDLTPVVINSDYKYLSFTYDSTTVEQKTGVGGWRLVRFLPPTATAWHQGNDNLAGTLTYGTAYNYTNAWSIPFGTFDEFVFGTLNLQYWMRITKTAAIGATYEGANRNIISSSFSSTPYTALQYYRAGNPEDPWMSIKDHAYNTLEAQIVYGENATTANTPLLIPLDGGMGVWVRNSAETQPTLPSQTSYTVNFPESTLCDILVVGGGGGGGNDRGGGGGGGGVIYSQNITLNGTYTIMVGKEGVGTTSSIPSGLGTRGTNGSNSSISGSNITTITAIGGGGGAACNPSFKIGLDGGSGGGGSQYNGAGNGGSGTIGQGNNGGIGYEGGAAGGGGGAVAVGTNANSTNAGNGGIGLSNSITGTAVIYGSGGGGGGSSGSGLYPQVFGTGGSIGAGNGTNGHINGNNATIFGCGGGGAGIAQTSVTTGGKGFAGVVIIRYKSSKLGNQTYKVGNYSGEFKVISSISNTDTDYIKITTAGAITNPTGTASWNTGSDRRIKENIERASYDKCYENINRLELNRFNYISGFNTVNRDRTQLGFIAQEVYEIFPKSISSQEYYSNTLNIPDLLSIDVTQINYSLYGAVKKLIEINNEKDNRIKTLDNRLKTLKTILNIATEPSTSNIVIDTSSTSNIVIDTSSTSNIVIDTSSTSNIVIDTSSTSNIVIDTSSTSNIVIDALSTSNIAVDT